MPNTNSTPNTENASLQDFADAESTPSPTVEHDPGTDTVNDPDVEHDNDSDADAPVEEEASTDDSESVRAEDDSRFALDAFDDPHLRDLVRELSPEEIDGLIEHMQEEKDIIAVVEEATDDEELVANIDSITDHYADRPSLVEAAGDYVEEAFGMRPFDLTITEPEDEYLTPMISLDVDDDVRLTNNPELNTEILSHVTRIIGVTESGQRRVFKNWQQALGGERVVEFKRDREPHALGFTIPGHIPTTGNDPEKTPITEIPYIGEATAADLHPSGGLLSVEDYVGLTEEQLVWIDLPVDNKDYDTPRARGIARGFAEHAPDDADLGDVLGKALDMMDRRESEGDMAWVNPANAFGITLSDAAYRDADLKDIVDVTEEDGDILVETTDGTVTKFAGEYWKMLDEVSDSLGVDIEVGVLGPAFVSLPENGYMIAAPINPEE